MSSAWVLSSKMVLSSFSFSLSNALLDSSSCVSNSFFIIIRSCAIWASLVSSWLVKSVTCSCNWSIRFSYCFFWGKSLEVSAPVSNSFSFSSNAFLSLSISTWCSVRSLLFSLSNVLFSSLRFSWNSNSCCSIFSAASVFLEIWVWSFSLSTVISSS